MCPCKSTTNMQSYFKLFCLSFFFCQTLGRRTWNNGGKHKLGEKNQKWKEKVVIDFAYIHLNIFLKDFYNKFDKTTVKIGA